jgi:hypothetical protein
MAASNAQSIAERQGFSPADVRIIAPSAYSPPEVRTRLAEGGGPEPRRRRAPRMARGLIERCIAKAKEETEAGYYADAYLIARRPATHNLANRLRILARTSRTFRERRHFGAWLCIEIVHKITALVQELRCCLPRTVQQLSGAGAWNPSHWQNRRYHSNGLTILSRYPVMERHI